MRAADHAMKLHVGRYADQRKDRSPERAAKEHQDPEGGTEHHEGSGRILGAVRASITEIENDAGERESG